MLCSKRNKQTNKQTKCNSLKEYTWKSFLVTIDCATIAKRNLACKINRDPFANEFTMQRFILCRQREPFRYVYCSILVDQHLITEIHNKNFYKNTKSHDIISFPVYTGEFHAAVQVYKIEGIDDNFIHTVRG